MAKVVLACLWKSLRKLVGHPVLKRYPCWQNGMCHFSSFELYGTRLADLLGWAHSEVDRAVPIGKADQVINNTTKHASNEDKVKEKGQCVLKYQRVSSLFPTWLLLIKCNAVFRWRMLLRISIYMVGENVMYCECVLLVWRAFVIFYVVFRVFASIFCVTVVKLSIVCFGKLWVTFLC